MNMEIRPLHIEVQNWKAYVNRADIKRPGYFNFPVKYFADPEFISMFEPFSIGIFCYICCHATKGAGHVEINFRHVKAYLNCSEAEFRNAVASLQQNSLVTVHVTDTCHARNVHVTDTYAELNRIELNRTEQNGTELNARTYVPCTTDGELIALKPKRERKAKPELSYEPIPELEEIREIITNRKLPTVLQASWMKLYHPRTIIAAVRKADNWAIAKGEEKKSWPMFFNNWLKRDAHPQPLQAARPPPTQEIKPERKKFFLEQLEKNGGQNEPK